MLGLNNIVSMRLSRLRRVCTWNEIDQQFEELRGKRRQEHQGFVLAGSVQTGTRTMSNQGTSQNSMVHADARELSFVRTVSLTNNHLHDVCSFLYTEYNAP